MEAACMVSLALFAIASAVPTNVFNRDVFDNDFDSCALTCKDQNKKFAYKQATTYLYDYTVNTETSMFGASEDEAKLSIEVNAEIQSLDGCDFALLLKNVKVFHSDDNSAHLVQADREDEIRRLLEGSNLRFAFNDGVISHICPEVEENTWALNFKRGLLTNFQASMENLDKSHTVTEVDVSGTCDTHFTVPDRSWSWTKKKTITKTKNLVTCSQRDHYRSFYQMVPYTINSEVQSMPILKGDIKCDYEIRDNRILESVACSENHIYSPFSNDNNGARTVVRQKLQLKGQKDGVDAVKGPVKARYGLTYDHGDMNEKLQNGPESLEQKLKEICDQTQDDIRPETPRLYSELVQIIKVLSKPELERAYKLVKDKLICPKNGRALKFFMDALPMAETEGALSLMTTLINGRQVEGVLAKAWVVSVALIQNPTSNMMESGLKLLQGPSSSNALLPVSALVNKYCKHVSDCESEDFVSQILGVLTNRIPNYCKVDDKNLKDVLVTLRAIGNVGHTALISSIDKCMSSTSAPLDVKVAAADAYRRIPCDTSFSQSDSTLWTILNDASQEPELRITSYLSVMRCPNDDTLSKVSQLLDTETDENVGGFIYSHINNLKETSDPLKQDIAKAISLHTFKMFDQNLFKYSSNHEASMLINKLNLGFTADSNVIMSSNSPLPRSAMLNLTVDLFGNSINLLEVGGRVEGLELLIETLLGPTGYFSSKTVKWDEHKLKDVKGSFYTRVFGHEIFYGNVKNSQGLPALGQMPNLLDLLYSFANRQAVAYTYSMQLMDISLIVPTIAGLPLEITVNGSMNLDLKAEGKADLRSVAASPRSMEIEGEVRPSAALEVTGTMAINAMVTKVGLRMRNTMHSSTWLKGHIEINRGRVLSIEIEPPGDKMEIFNARSQFFIIHNNVEKEQKMLTDNYQEHKLCSGDKVATILGVELCGELKFPNASLERFAPYFPLTGPTSFSVMTYRRDTHNSYKLLAKRKESKESSTAQFMLDTPNSQVNRMISVDFTIGYTPDKQIDLVIVSPWKKLSVNSALVTNNNILSFVSNVILDNSDKYGLTTEVKISKTGNMVTYIPFVELTQAGSTDTLLSGRVNVDSPNKFSTNLAVKGVGMLPYNVEGALINEDKEKRVQLSLSNDGKTLYMFNLGSTFERSGKDNRNIKVEPTLLVKTGNQAIVSITGSSDYKADRAAVGDLIVDVYLMKPASVSWKISQSSKPKQSNYNVDLKVKSSLMTGSIDGDISHQRNLFSSKLKVGYNIPKFATDTVTWTTKINNRSKNTFSKYLLTTNVDMKKYTDYNAGLTFDIGYKKKQTDVDVELKYGANPKDKKKVVKWNSSLKTDINSWKNADIDLQLKTQAPEKNIDLNVKMTHAHAPSKLESNMNLKFAPFLKNPVDAGVILEDKSGKAMNYMGEAKLGIMGKKFAISTNLNEKSPKYFQHSIDVQDFNGGSHSASTVYKVLNSNGHEVTSQINVDGYKQVQLQGKTTLDPSNFLVAGSVVYGKDTYNASSQTKLTDTMKKINFNLLYPDRQMEADVELKNMKDKVTGSLIVDWDVNKNTKSKVSVEASYRNSASWDSRVVNGAVKVTTPFIGLQSLSVDGSYNRDASQYSSKAKVSWGGKEETISSNVQVKRPLSLENAEITFEATSPFRKFREIELQINHKIKPVFTSSVKGKLDNNEGQLVVKGENRGDQYNRDFYGSMDLKSSFNAIKEISVSLEHKDDGKAFKTSGSFGHNSRKFDAAFQMDHSSIRYGVVNKGNLTLTWPEDQLYTTWQHTLEENKHIKCTLESTWSRTKRLSINLAGSNILNYEGRYVLVTVDADTPWKNHKNINVKFNNILTSDKFESTGFLVSDRVDKIRYNILLESKPTSGNAMFMVKTPLYDQKVHGQTEINWSSYPATASVWLEWAPWARIDFDGSLSAPSVDDLELNTKLTTPFTNFENIIARASHKLESSEYVSSATLNYGVRKMVDLVNRFRYDDDVKLFRTTLTSPCPYLKSLDTGLRLTTSSDKFEGSVDFELQPLVRKYDGFTFWNYDPDNWSGKLLINTPLKQLSHFQVNSWSKKNPDSLRVSHLDIQPSPYGLYSLDSSYRLNVLPYQLDVNLKTPHRGYDKLGLFALHNPTTSSLQSRLRLMFQSNKDIATQLNLDWKDNYEGSFLVNTPFAGYESNKIIARHDRTSRGFTCHGEANVGERKAQGDIVYTSSSSVTSASAIFLTPIPGYETLSGNFSVRGPVNQMKGDASIGFGSNTMSTVFTNTVSLGLFKSTIALYTPYTQDLKLSIQLKDSTDYTETNLESSFNGQYGDQSADGKLGVVYAGPQKTKVDIGLNTPYRSGQVSVESSINSDGVSGKVQVQTNINSIGNIEASFDKNGPFESMVSTASLLRNHESLIDTLVETNTANDNVNGKIVTKGKWLPELAAEVDHKGSISDFNTKLKLSGSDGNALDSDIALKIEGSEIDASGNMNVVLNSEDHTYSFSLHKEGTWTDFKVHLTEKLDGDEATGVLEFEAQDQIKGRFEVSNLSSDYDKIGVEFEHSGDLEKFMTTGKVTLSSRQAVSGKVNFYRYNLKRIEASAELNTPWQGYRYSSIEYRHEGQSDRLSCNFNIQYGDGQKLSADLATQCSSSAHSVSFNIKTPFQGYEEMSVSGDIDTSKTNVKVALGKDTEFTVTGVHDTTIYPYLIQYQITTPLDVLKKVSLTLKGKPLDGSIDLTLLSLNKKIEGNGALQYSSPYKMSLTTQVSSDVQGFKLLQMNLKNNDDALKGRTTHLLVSWDPTQQIVVDGRYFSGSSRWTSKKENVLELDIKVPFGQYRSISVDMSCNTEQNNVQSLVSLEVNQNKLIDLDMNFEKNGKYEYSTTVRKPWPIQYTISYQLDDYMQDADIFVSWNRNDPTSNVRIKGTMQNQPSNNDKSLSLTISGPYRTIGVEHSLSRSTDKLSSSGKLFWNQDDSSKVYYSIDISSSNRRRDKSYSGDFKLGLPCRTLGISGSASNNDLVRTADAAFSWDLGNDNSKRVEIQISVSGQEYTKADISFKLPAQDLQVNTALILNQGNTIIDGKTDISYSSESRKTLTLFSKLKNTPANTYSFFSDSGNSFNYSVELGLSHPETKVDVKIDSHVASSDEFLTSSLGVRYLTVRRQMKNLALFAEIDKIRKQISFVATGPSQNTGVSATILNTEPLSLVVLGSLDGQEKFKSTLNIDTDNKMFQFDIGQPDNLLSLKSYYPNNSAIQVELYHKNDYNKQKEAVIGLRLMNSHLLHSRITWRPTALDELQNFVAQQISAASLNTQSSLSQINTDLRTELAGKYESVTGSTVEDLKPLLEYIRNELETFATDLENAKRKLNDMQANNEFFLQDIGNIVFNNIYYMSLTYDLVQDYLQNGIDLYRNTYITLIETLGEYLEQIKEFSFSDSYNQVVTQALQTLMQMLDGNVASFVRRLRETDLQISKRAETVLLNVRDLYNHQWLTGVRDRINTLSNIDYIDYLQKVHNAARENINLGQYADVLYSLKDSAVRTIVPEIIRDTAERATNEIHQQAFLAIKHWELDALLSKYAKTSIELLKDIAEDELREYINLISIQSPITLFDPENGRVEANLILPIEIKTLDELPDLTSYIQQVKDVYIKYAPNMEALYQFNWRLLSSNKTEVTNDDLDDNDDILANLDDFNPIKNLKDRYVYQN